MEKKELNLVKLKYRLDSDIFSVKDLMKVKDVTLVNITEVLFADDAELLACSGKDLQVMLDVFVEVSDAYGQEVSIKKTEVMRLVRDQVSKGKTKQVVNGEERSTIRVKGAPLNEVSVFKYVGSTENNNGRMDAEVNIRIQKMGMAYNLLATRLFDNENISLAAKWETFQAVVLSNALYGCASWTVTYDHIARLEAKQFQLLRRMLGWKWADFKSNEDVISSIAFVGGVVLPIEGRIRLSRLRYLGHVERGDVDFLPKVVLHAEHSVGTRRSGGQELNYKMSIKKDLELFGIDLKTWRSKAVDRSEWRKALLLGTEMFKANWFMKRVVKRVVKRGRREVRSEHNGDVRVMKSAVNVNAFSPDAFYNITKVVNSGDGRVVVGRGGKEYSDGRRKPLRKESRMARKCREERLKKS